MDSGHVVATQVAVVGSPWLAPCAAKARLLGTGAGEGASMVGEAGAAGGLGTGKVAMTTEALVAP